MKPSINPFEQVVIDGLVVCHIYQHEHDHNAYKAVNDLIDWHVEVALEPKVSAEATNLRNTYLPYAHHMSKCRSGEGECTCGLNDLLKKG